jgi:hypothetical protein
MTTRTAIVVKHDILKLTLAPSAKLRVRPSPPGTVNPEMLTVEQSPTLDASLTEATVQVCRLATRASIPARRERRKAMFWNIMIDLPPSRSKLMLFYCILPERTYIPSQQAILVIEYTLGETNGPDVDVGKADASIIPPREKLLNPKFWGCLNWPSSHSSEKLEECSTILVLRCMQLDCLVCAALHIILAVILMGVSREAI